MAGELAAHVRPPPLAALELPLDCARPAQQRHLDAGRVPFKVWTGGSNQLHALRRAAGCGAWTRGGTETPSAMSVRARAVDLCAA